MSSTAAVRPDVASLVTLFGRELHRAGVPVSTAETDCLARTLELCRPATVDELYWCARVSLLRSIDSVAAFDAVFAMVFRGLVDTAEYRGQSALARPADEAPPSIAEQQAPAVSVGSSPRASAASGDPRESATHALRALASSDERLYQADFGQLDEEELRALAPLLHRLLTAIPTRLSRRRHQSPRGDLLDLRATLRRSTR